MTTSLLLTFIHGFKGNENTFYSFPQLKRSISKAAPDLNVDYVVYPKYETRGDLPDCVEGFREWLMRQILVREKAAGNDRPQTSPTVGVVLVAHSMGGLVAADAVLSTLDDGPNVSPDGSNASPDSPGPNVSPNVSSSHVTSHRLFPAIQGILAFDTPYIGLSRSMFAYGAFAQYRTISSAYGLVTSASAIPAQLIGSTGTGTATSSALDSATADKPAWKIWQTIAMRTGAAGAIAAAGAAAYMNRENLGKGLQYMNKEDISRGLSATVNMDNIRQALSMVNKDQLQQGFAYMSRENIGQGFAWLSGHLQFVSALARGAELRTRIERLSALEGLGFADLYTSLGPNDMWSGGYFVAERTFCAVPADKSAAERFFIKEINPKAKDEIEAHLSMFADERNPGLEEMRNRATGLIISWARSHRSGVVRDHYKPPPPKVNEPTLYLHGEKGFKQVTKSQMNTARKKNRAGRKGRGKGKETAEEPTAITLYTYGDKGLTEYTKQGKRQLVQIGGDVAAAQVPLPSDGDPDATQIPLPLDGDATQIPLPGEEGEELDLDSVPGVTEDLVISESRDNLHE